MEDFSFSNTSWGKSNNYTNISGNDTGPFGDTSSLYTAGLIANVVTWIVICTGLPLTLVAIAAVYSLVRKDHVTPVYIINLLVSDLVQLCCMIAEKAGVMNTTTPIYVVSLKASVGCMVCISLERYLMITQPLWYRFRRNIRTAVVVCVVVWILPPVILVLVVNLLPSHLFTTAAVYLLLPFPLFIFCLVGTIKALSAARSVPADEKRRIVAILVMVLLIYTLLFLPIIIVFSTFTIRYYPFLNVTASALVRISPLTDLTLYILIRKGTIDKLLDSLCCC